MGRKQYNSAADRRWQQRFQRIQERKEANWEYDQARRERRREIKDFYISQGFNPDKLVKEDKVAVVCRSQSQVRQVLNEMRKKYSEYIRYSYSDAKEIWDFYEPEVALGLFTEDYYFFENITYLRPDTCRYFENHGYNIVDFFECIPVKDLGEMCVEEEYLVSSLLGI